MNTQRENLTDCLEEQIDFNINIDFDVDEEMDKILNAKKTPVNLDIYKKTNQSIDENEFPRNNKKNLIQELTKIRIFTKSILMTKITGSSKVYLFIVTFLEKIKGLNENRWRRKYRKLKREYQIIKTYKRALPVIIALLSQIEEKLYSININDDNNKNQIKQKSFHRYVRRARSMIAQEDFGEEKKRFVREFWNYRCAACNRSRRFYETSRFPIDHWLPLAPQDEDIGNPLSMNNAVLMCPQCNGKKSNKNSKNVFGKDVVDTIELKLRDQAKEWMEKTV